MMVDANATLYMYVYKFVDVEIVCNLFQSTIAHCASSIARSLAAASHALALTRRITADVR